MKQTYYQDRREGNISNELMNSPQMSILDPLDNSKIIIWEFKNSFIRKKFSLVQMITNQHILYQSPTEIIAKISSSNILDKLPSKAEMEVRNQNSILTKIVIDDIKSV